MKKLIIATILCISWELNAQVALPTFQGTQIARSSGSQTFSYTGSQQTFTVPSFVESIIIKAWGAAGGVSTGNLAGGQGAIIQSIFPVTSGTNLTVSVGGKGGSTTHGTSGCGGGQCMQGEGGDGSYVSQDGDPLIVAGGGGGSVYWSGNKPGANASYGESGSTSANGSGTPGTNGNNGSSNNYSQDGNGWYGDPKCAGGNTIAFNSNGGSGAGAGGYSGGGSGSGGWGGGGGGGSFTASSGSTQQNIGYNDGNGQVIISW